MVIKIFAVVLLLLVMEITYLSTQEPITLQIRQPKIDFSDVTFEKLDAYLITTERIKARLTADRALTYKTRNELYDINATLHFDDHDDSLVAQKAIYRPRTLHLINDIVYDSNHSLLLKSDDLVYNTHTDIAISHTPFRLEQKRAVAEGSYMEYHAKTRHLKANDVVFTIEEEE